MGQKASIVSRGNMSQKSISSFFSKAASKKTDEKTSKTDVSEENPAKTKACQDSSSATLTKKRVGVLTSDSDEDSKENSKDLANKVTETSKTSPAKIASEPEVPVLDEDGLPPLRKTARNPAFKRKADEDQDSTKKLKDNFNEGGSPIDKENEPEEVSKEKKCIASDEKKKIDKKVSPKRKKNVIES